jgi:hypothetical protein
MASVLDSRNPYPAAKAGIKQAQYTAAKAQGKTRI